MDRHKQQTVGFWKRFLAVIIDWLILSILATIVALVLEKGFGIDVNQPKTMEAYQWLAYSAEALLLIFVLYCWVRLQGTPGKLLLGCRIVNEKTGTAPSLSQASIRLLGYLVSLLPLCLGFFWTLWDSRRQGFHDKLAHTLVVLDDESEKSIQQLAQELR